jgi:hypothetical protein
MYGQDWWMDFVKDHESVDVNFHEKDLGFCKLTGCNAVRKDGASYNCHVRYCIFNHDFGEYAPFWELLKANLRQYQEVNLMKFRLRCNTLRIEEDGIVSFTNNQHEVEIYTNSVVKGPEKRLGDLRIGKEEDGLPKELINRRIPKLSRREKILQAQEGYKEKKRERRIQEDKMHIETVAQGRDKLLNCQSQKRKLNLQ